MQADLEALQAKYGLKLRIEENVNPWQDMNLDEDTYHATAQDSMSPTTAAVSTPTRRSQRKQTTSTPSANPLPRSSVRSGHSAAISPKTPRVKPAAHVNRILKEELTKGQEAAKAS